ncbi:acyl--CoA ligase [Nocardia otitidiscaviarum]|uniref:class I adenylate-forming enzyme family protein n=1 Tax=Nocardia otitidiscaviarum TaxID=1823 RepID=UPI0005BD1C17|nr:class I adenylate-forming enzyme family protein [Nocardia otitidiscaviarum]MBF6133840.1 acyl--CoA ligase [Nocardia otitidiscaviarum]MBF6487868.1 acyl--CoA ligase [Nocardia otitidiscaviarum]
MSESPRPIPTCHPDETVRHYLDRGWWEPETLPQALRRRVDATPDAAAVSDPANLADLTGAAPRTLSWREFDDYTLDLASVLFAHGVRQGDAVAVLLPNSVALTAVYFALWRLGAVATPMPVSYRRHELSGIVAATGATAVITVGRLVDRKLALEAGEVVRTVFVFGPDAANGAVVLDETDTAARERVREYESGLAVTVNDRVTICWTSGTEAAPKGVPRCHGDWLAMARGVQDGLQLTPDAVVLNPFPMVNMAGFAGSFLPWLLVGGHLVQHQPLDLPVFFGQIAQHRVSHTSMPPALLTMLVQNDALRASTDLGSLRRVGSGGAPLPPGVVRRWQEEFGIEVLNYFGSNEGVCLLGAPADIPDPTVRAQHLPHYGAPGVRWSTRLAESTAVKLVDLTTGKTVTEPGGRGELRLRGPAVFGGYLPGTAAAEPFDADGFLCSGDIFELRGEDGRYLRFVDRAKEIIIRGGMNIAPAEIEGLLTDHPGVVEVAIVGYPDPVLGEKCCAFVVPAAGATVTLADLVAHLRALEVASFKLPERLELVEALPRNPVGKILRRELRDTLAAQD